MSRPRIAACAAVSVALVAVVAVVLFVVAGSGSDRNWDLRVLPIARFVAHDRGLQFTRPVPAVFMTPAAFRARVAADSQAAAAPAATLDQQAAELRVLGLADGHLDLNRLETCRDAGTTAGFYDDRDHRLYVEGTTLTPYVRVTIAHELTHALQDQHLGLGRLNSLPGDHQPAVSALIEGDAVVVEGDYRAKFSAAEETQYQSEERSAGGSGPTDLPDFLGYAGSFPYDLGPTFVDALVAAGGNDRVDQAFSAPPVNEGQIADPSTYLQHRATPAVPAPALPAGPRSCGAARSSARSSWPRPAVPRPASRRGRRCRAGPATPRCSTRRAGGPASLSPPGWTPASTPARSPRSPAPGRRPGRRRR